MNTGTIIYLVLTLIALFPLAGIPPFTLMFSAPSNPKIVRQTYKFKRTNHLLSYFWAVLFAICALLSWLYHGETAGWLAPMLVCLVIGMPVTIIGALLLPQYIKEKYPYTSCQQLFALMPHGVCKRYARAADIHAVVQFHLDGTEPIEGFLRIDRTRCSFEYGLAPELKAIQRDAQGDTQGQALENPAKISTLPPSKENLSVVEVYCNSDLWLAISNGERDGAEESILGNLRTVGNPSVMIQLQRLFLTGWKIDMPVKLSVRPDLYSEYDQLQPVKIRKAVVFYSGKRSSRVSKTLLMVNHLMEGLQEKGCEVERIDLAKMKIEPCLGCYNCWTKTPGQCVHRDEMSMEQLAMKYVDADLAVFASPLYTFSVNGVMKTFMDRLIPMLLPYMAKNEKGDTMHPKRYRDSSPTHTLVVSAAGFPEIEGNFDGVRTLYKSWAHHMEGSTLRGELLLPAAELLQIPEFTDRRMALIENCREIGRCLATNGCIPSSLMREVSNTRISNQEFAHLANLFWKNLDGKQAYMNFMPKYPLE